MRSLVCYTKLEASTTEKLRVGCQRQRPGVGRHLAHQVGSQSSAGLLVTRVTPDPSVFIT